MKRLFTLAVVLFISACAAPPANRETLTNGNSNRAETTAPALTQAEAITKEKEVWNALEKKDYDGFANLLADDMIYVAPEAVYDRAGTVKGVNGFAPQDISFSDWKFTSVDKDAGVISYTISLKVAENGKPAESQTLRAGTAWVNRNGKWVAIYHQDGEIMKPPAMPTATPTAKTTTSPMASMSPATTSSDVEANEKAVWAALKAKDYNGFGSFLAPNAIEVEPTGVYDKAGSVKGVQELNASAVQLSDFKALKFDDDAALVTYVVKIPNAKPDTERHSTIWANINGKWQAVYHQGTPAKPMPAATPMKSPAM
ncbi:MAG: DUF4440 domain-containing protein [Pyrinomonadaceae bacterium]